MIIDPKCQNSQGETLALASLPFYGDCEPNMIMIMTIDPRKASQCRNSQGETLAFASPATFLRTNRRLKMTTAPAIPSERANACRTRFGCARPFASLPGRVKEKIIFDSLTGLALWCAEGDGHEPPPYWRDEGGDIHNL